MRFSKASFLFLYIPDPKAATLAEPRDPSVLYSSISASHIVDRVCLKIELKNRFAFPAYMILGSKPVFFIISIPYLKAKAMPSCEALKT